MTLSLSFIESSLEDLVKTLPADKFKHFDNHFKTPIEQKLFEAFRDTVISSYHLDPTHYVSLPGFAWDAMLKKTQIKLDVINDYDMYLLIENNIHGGMSMISHRPPKQITNIYEGL